MRCMALFPSPIGVLYISMSMIEFCCDDLVLFPSPIGVLYISILKEGAFTEKCIIVSVPYWGSLYFNVPDRKSERLSYDEFPSPIGVLYISISREDDQ